MIRRAWKSCRAAFPLLGSSRPSKHAANRSNVTSRVCLTPKGVESIRIESGKHFCHRQANPKCDSPALTGGCACGKLRYECDEKPIVQLICHCRDCQRASGSAFAAVLFVPSDRLTFKRAEPKYHSVKAESGRTMQRGFCGECGSPL